MSSWKGDTWTETHTHREHHVKMKVEGRSQRCFYSPGASKIASKPLQPGEGPGADPPSQRQNSRASCLLDPRLLASRAMRRYISGELIPLFVSMRNSCEIGKVIILKRSQGWGGSLSRTRAPHIPRGPAVDGPPSHP